MIILRYLSKEVINSLLFVVIILLFIFVSNQFVRYLADAASGQLLAGVLPRLMLLYIPYLLAFLLPLGLFLGILLTYGRFYNDNEMYALMSCGMTQRQLILITLKIAILMSLIVSFLTLWLDPRLLIYRNHIMAESRGANLIQTLQEGRFQSDSSGRQVYYIETLSRDHEQLNNIFVAQQKKNEPDFWDVISASGGYAIPDQKTQDKFLVATEGFRYSGKPGEVDFYIGQFEKYGLRIVSKSAPVRSQLEGVSFSELLHEMKLNNALAYAEFQWRFAMPVATILLALLAIPLSVLRPRQGRFAKILPALLIFTVYANMLFVARHWVEQGDIPPSLGIWSVHAAMLLLIFILLMDLPRLWRTRKKMFKRFIA